MSDQNNFNQSQENNNQPGAYYDGSNSQQDFQSQFNQQFNPQGNMNNNQNNQYSQQPYTPNDPNYQGQNNGYNNPYPNQNYNNYYGQQPQQPVRTADVPAIVSLVCGIVSIVTCCLWPLSILLCIVGIIFGIISKKVDGKKSGVAIAGIIICAIMLIVGILFLVLFIDSWNTFKFSTDFDEFFKELERIGK